MSRTGSRKPPARPSSGGNAPGRTSKRPTHLNTPQWFQVAEPEFSTCLWSNLPSEAESAFYMACVKANGFLPLLARLGHVFFPWHCLGHPVPRAHFLDSYGFSRLPGPCWRIGPLFWRVPANPLKAGWKPTALCRGGLPRLGGGGSLRGFCYRSGGSSRSLTGAAA